MATHISSRKSCRRLKQTVTHRVQIRTEFRDSIGEARGRAIHGIKQTPSNHQETEEDCIFGPNKKHTREESQ